MTSTKVVSQKHFYSLKYTHFLLWHVAIARLPGLPRSFILVIGDRVQTNIKDNSCFCKVPKVLLVLRLWL